MATRDWSARQRIQFAFNADADSIIGCVFQYLIKNSRFSSREGKQKGIDAMLAFYKPFAYQVNETVDERELQAIARDSVQALSQQIELLCNTFNVERPSAIAHDLRVELKQALAEILTNDGVWIYPNPVERSLERPLTSPYPGSPLTGRGEQEDRIAPDNKVNWRIDWDDEFLLGDLQTHAEAAS